MRSSTRRAAETHAWKVGAAGEERVAQALTALVDSGDGYALHDRRVPGKRSNIDHLFVGATAVFVIDAKRYKNADVTVERTGGLFSPVTETLKVGGRRKNDLVEAVHRQCEVVNSRSPPQGTRTWPSSRCCVSSTPSSPFEPRTVASPVSVAAALAGWLTSWPRQGTWTTSAGSRWR